jgi:hypothetical protein
MKHLLRRLEGRIKRMQGEAKKAQRKREGEIDDKYNIITL